jgi:hypothetical protein
VTAARLAGLLASLVVAGAPCRQLVGIGDSPPTALDAGPACGIAPAAGSCETCLEAQCCAEATACSGSAACITLETCLGACGGDPSCRAQCAVTYPPGQDLTVPALEACLVQCEPACGVACGGIAEFAPPGAAAACERCVKGAACSDIAQCMADPYCQAIAWCVRSQDALPAADGFRFTAG